MEVQLTLTDEQLDAIVLQELNNVLEMATGMCYDKKIIKATKRLINYYSYPQPYPEVEKN